VPAGPHQPLLSCRTPIRSYYGSCVDTSIQAWVEGFINAHWHTSSANLSSLYTGSVPCFVSPSNTPTPGVYFYSPLVAAMSFLDNFWRTVKAKRVQHMSVLHHSWRLYRPIPRKRPLLPVNSGIPLPKFRLSFVLLS
jgi:hypothetical protein